MASLQLITGPSVEPITLAELKLQCRVDGSSEDALLALIIQAARAKAENYTGTAIISQVWEQKLDAFPEGDDIEIAKPPATAIGSVSYVDLQGATVTLANSAYTLDGQFPGWVLPAAGTAWPATLDCAGAVTIRYTAGYADAASIPADMRAWLLLTAAFLYAQREAFVIDGKVQEIPGRFTDSLLDPYRVFKL